ncbi:MAG: O-antigen ligase family protein [bacterium]|nr:O-antigen ligase family protein [bacterium]
MKDSSRKYQHFFIQVGILVTFFIIPMWLRIPNAPKSFSRAYILGFVWLIPLTFTLTIWVSSGFLGIRAVARNRRRTAFAFAILGLALWSSASQIWAFMRNTRPDMTLGVVGQMCLMALFAVMVLSVAPSPKWVVMALIAGMVAQGIIGAVQVTIQDDIGLRFLGEFRLDPAQGGVSVVQAGDVRWLRPYGLTPHPNIFAGYMLVGVLGALGVVMARFISTPREKPIVDVVGAQHVAPVITDGMYAVPTRMGAIFGNILILLFGLWMLFLTFSRGVWLGFTVALIGMLTILTLRRLWTKRALRMGVLVGIIMVGMGILFVVLYYPFILARAGVNEEYVEMRAVNERAIHISIAYAVFEDEPVWGVGIGNFAWYSTYYLRYKMRVDMKGENIHNVYLLALTELGIIGLVLMLAGLIVTITKFPKDPYRLALWGGVVGLAMVGLFDHYTWSILAYGCLWWGIMAVVIGDEKSLV